MRSPAFVSVTLICLPLLFACTSDDAPDEGADEVESSDSSSSSEAETDSSGSESSSSTDASSTEAESSSTETDASSTDADASSTDAESSSTEAETDSSSSESSTTMTTGTEESTTTDTGFESCEMIEQLYQDLVEGPAASVCNVDADCHVVDGHCWLGLGGCWYVVNQSVQQSELETLADGFTGLGCFGPICLCVEAPAAVACVDGTCAPL